MNVPAIGATLPANQVLDQSAMRPPALDALADKFNRLVEQQPAATPPNEAVAGPNSTVSRFVDSQESMVRQSFDAVRDFSAQAPGMNPSELAARQIQLNYQLAMVQVQFNAGVYIAQSSKSGLQTLMKNQ